MLVYATSSPHAFATTFGLIVAGIGLIFFLIGLLIWGTGHRFGRSAASARGTIVGFNATDPSMPRMAGSPVRVSTLPGFGASFVYRPTVEFNTPDGTSVRATSSIGTNPKSGKVGDSVTVLYDPRDPQHVRVASVAGRGTCLAVAFMLIGGAVAGLGIVVLLASR